MNLFEMFEEQKELTLIDALRDFLPLATSHLELDHFPKIKLVKSLDDTTFGRYVHAEQAIYVVVANRNPVDVLRTLAHEMVHYTQGLKDQLSVDAGETGSTIENEANAEGGVIMREFNAEYPKYLRATPVVLPESKLFEKKVATIYLDKLVVDIDDHLIDQKFDRKVNYAFIDRAVRRLPNATDKILKIEAGHKFWVYNLALNIGLGFRKMGNPNLVLLKTVVGNRPWESDVPIIDI